MSGRLALPFHPPVAARFQHEHQLQVRRIPPKRGVGTRFRYSGRVPGCSWFDSLATAFHAVTRSPAGALVLPHGFEG